MSYVFALPRPLLFVGIFFPFAVITKILEHLNLPSEVPKARPARPPPEREARELWDAVDPVYDDPA